MVIGNAVDQRRGSGQLIMLIQISKLSAWCLARRHELVVDWNGDMTRRKSLGWHLIGLMLLGAVATATPCQAQGLVIYPAKGQSPAQQDQDRYACHRWAVQQSGYDPSLAAPQPAPYGATPMRGAVRGAAVGAVGGAIGGNAGKGAAIGAASGALIGGIRRRDQNRQQQSSASQQRSLYNRALGTCMQGRGYTVG
jgi:hypothetical protein